MRAPHGPGRVGRRREGAVTEPSSPLVDRVGRRTFLKVLGSAGPAAAAAACSPVPPERIIPFVVPPDDVVPGVATWYASVCGECPAGCGIRVRTREGRAVKVEGNPEHPVNRGGLCVRGQASLQGLYNPDRITGPRRRRVTDPEAGRSVLEPVAWDEAQQALVDRLQALYEAGRGDRVALITPPLTGTLAGLVSSWTSALGARWVRYEPFGYEAIRAANERVFGRREVPHYDFARAEMVVSFGADFLETFGSPAGFARDHAGQRRVRDGRTTRFVQIEPRLSMTGAGADVWHAVAPQTEGLVAAAMVQAIVSEQRAQGIQPDEAARIGELVAGATPEAVSGAAGLPAERIRELARAFSDPARGPGRTLAVGGGVGVSGANATAAQVAVSLLNHVAGNVGSTVDFGAASTVDAAAYADMQGLADAMRAGEVELAIVHDVNPVFAMPAAADFRGAVAGVPFVAALSSLPDETTAQADLLLPVHTALESWGDSNPRRGVWGLMQPTMRPVFDTRHVGDLLIDVARALGGDMTGYLPRRGDYYRYLREAWEAMQPVPEPVAESPAVAQDSTASAETPAAADAATRAANQDAPPADPLAPPGDAQAPAAATITPGNPQAPPAEPAAVPTDGQDAPPADQPAAPADPLAPAAPAVASGDPQAPAANQDTAPAAVPPAEPAEPAAPAPEPPDFETWWADALRRGGVTLPVAPVEAALRPGVFDANLAAELGAPAPRRRFSLVAYPSLHFFDGRGANRPWLQEIPDPLLKTTWGTGVEMTPATAEALGAAEGQLVTVASDHGQVDASVIVNPHLAEGVVAIAIGQGHTDFGRYATGRGVSPMALLDPAPETPSGGVRWVGTGVDVTPRELSRPIPRLQRNFDQEGRGLAQSVSLAALAAGEVHPEDHHFSLYPEHEHPVHSWGMAIDLDACNGCNACVAACYAENNVPVMGADRMRRGRTMSWLRIERFDEPRAGGDGADVRFLPMLCQHCDHAPCESVCPVYATYHTDEGLNAQIYNRCVGTRYCSNNCPYKVRRFNWFMPEFEAPLQLQLNPDVTARSDGVMEKCSFCVQRIQDGKERARDEDRPVRDGDVSPACAQSCPAQAIVFGDMNDPASRVTQLSADARAYHALAVFNTRPAVTYLKKVNRDA